MGQLTNAQWRRLDQALRGLYVHADAEAFPARLLESVRPLVGSDISCYSELNPVPGGVRNVADPPSELLDSLLPVLGEFQSQHPRLIDFARTGNTRALTVSDFLSRADWHRRDLYQHFYGALGLEDQVSIMIPAQRDVMIGLALNRDRRTFDDGDRRLLDALRPHLTLAWQNAQAVSQLEGPASSEQEAPASSLVRLGNDAAVLFAAPRAKKLLRRYFPERRARNVLPEPVRHWVLAFLSGAGDEAVAPRHYARRAQGLEGILSLRLVRHRDLDGWLLLLRERRKRPRADLPPRLRRVLDRLLHGESEKEIAARLGLSVHTVHEYTKQLYRRLGVSSRAHLMACWILRRGDRPS